MNKFEIKKAVELTLDARLEDYSDVAGIYIWYNAKKDDYIFLYNISFHKVINLLWNGYRCYVHLKDVEYIKQAQMYLHGST